MDSTVALNASSISKSFADVQAVKAVDLALQWGKCFSLLGRNGAGKTTICEMLVGVIAPDSGLIEIFGRPFTVRRKERRKILEDLGVLSQETQLYKKFTVRETITLFASFYRTRLDVSEVISLVGLGEKQDKRLENLSGGERQRVYLGAALVGDPKIVFLDEPTTGLDPMSRRNVWQIIDNLKRDGKSIFLTTHYMEEAAQLADDVAIIEQGTIVAQGSPRQLIKRYCEEDIITVSLNKVLNEVQFATLQRTYPHSLAIDERVYEVKAEQTFAAIKYLTSFCEQIEVEIQAMEFRKSTLEDVFFKLTGKKLPDELL